MNSCAWWSQLTSSEKAAWLQAIGSIVAIAVAFLIPVIQRWRERQDANAKDQRKARALATLLGPPINQWRDAFHDFEEAYREPDGISPSVLVAAAAQDGGLFTPPPVVTDNLAKLYLLGSGSDPLFGAINKSYEARSRARYLNDRHVGDDYSDATKPMAIIKRNYTLVQDDIREALSEIDKIRSHSMRASTTREADDE
jgi:hypothetical protein